MIKKKLIGIFVFLFFLGVVFLPNVNGNLLTNNFFQKFYNSELNLAPDFLQLGDIIFMDVKPYLTKKPFDIHTNNNLSDDHCAFYIGNNLFIESSDYSIFKKIGFFNGVQFTPMIFYRFWANNFTYYRVINASLSQRIEALRFLLKQFREPYQYGWPGFDDYMSWHCNPDIDEPTSPYYYPDDPYINYWFCTEIVWASYLHQGINIDATPDPIWDPDECGYFYLAGVNDIKNSENVTIL